MGKISVYAIYSTTLHREDGLSTKAGHQEIYRDAVTLVKRAKLNVKLLVQQTM